MTLPGAIVQTYGVLNYSVDPVNDGHVLLCTDLLIDG